METPNAKEALHSFIKKLPEWTQIRKKDIRKNLHKNHHFNPLRQISIKETDHSRILGDLLHRDGSHGQGTLFLDSFLEQIGIESGGKWNVTVETGRIDILLKRENPKSVVIIENKVHNASDQPGQLYRYWANHIHACRSDSSYEGEKVRKHFRLIYLPPISYSRPAEQSLMKPNEADFPEDYLPQVPEAIFDCLSFQENVADWLHGVISQNPKLSDRLKNFLTMYAEIWRLKSS